ncbi:MAG: NADH-quinone oxidoreductase subunit A [Clostridia bacterium]|nr:NADH-quinone oxidoreductase subunit A [Deltaproteobacteria bacterium]
MLEAHVPLFLMVILSVGLGGLLLTLSNFLGPRRPSKIKLEVFECGNPPTGGARDRFNVKFYLVAILFLVFDIEAVFVYPWAVTFSDAVHGKSSLAPAALAGSMLLFAGLLVVSLIYEWRKGALEWSGRSDDDFVEEHHGSSVRHTLKGSAGDHSESHSNIRAA